MEDSRKVKLGHWKHYWKRWESDRQQTLSLDCLPQCSNNVISRIIDCWLEGGAMQHLEDTVRRDIESLKQWT